MKPSSGALRYFAEIKNGTTPASDEVEYWDGDVKWATPEDLGNVVGGKIAVTRRQVTQKAVEETNLSVLPVGSVIVSTRAPIGHMAITEEPMAFNQGCRGIIPGDGVYGPFLYYLLKSRAPELNAVANGTTFVELSRDELAAVKVNLPPLEIQRRIAGFLVEKIARIDGLVEKKRTLLGQLAEKRQAFITRSIIKGLNSTAPTKPSGVDWYGDIPAHWEVTRLDRLTISTRPIRYGIVLPGPDFPNGVPIIKGGDVRLAKLRAEFLSRTAPEIDAAHERSRVVAGDIVCSIRGSFGDVEIVPCELDGCNLTQDTARISPIPGINRVWLLYALKSDAVRQQLGARAIGATIKGVNIYDLRRAIVPLPPTHEQDALASWISACVLDQDEASRKCELSIEKLSEYRSAIITAAVNGNLRLVADLAGPSLEEA